jgi:uncharacterized protein YneF (UPF0154 family)
VTSLRLVAAGGTFAGSALLGLLLGIWLAGRTGQQLWVLGGLLGGVAVGAFSAARLVMSEFK